ncbi:hypothetical protein ANO14919_130590 [Xylariales sp. No.14919]|nr:hypothetical protein ANO14919_130590 [Xylariales sp. No.14919]
MGSRQASVFDVSEETHWSIASSVDGRAEQTPTIPRRRPRNRTGGNINRLGTRPPAIPAFSSADLQPIANNLGLTDPRFPQRASGNLLAGDQSRLMTGLSNSSAAPSIAVSPSPQQFAFSSPSSLHSGTGPFPHSAVGNLGFYGPRMANQSQNPRAMLIVEYGLAVTVIINMSLPYSSICSETLQRAVSGSNFRRPIHPSPPPGQYTTTIAGYNPYGGRFTQLTLRSWTGNIGDDQGRDITLPLTITDRGLFGHGNGGIEADIVLGQNYLRLISSPNMIGPQNQFEGITQYPNQNYPGWQVTGYPTVANFASPEWSSGNNHLHPQSQGVNPSSSWTMVSSQGGSSHPVAAPSTTSPDMSFGPAPLN